MEEQQQEHAAVMRRLVDEVVNGQQLGLLGQLVTDSVLVTSPHTVGAGREEVERFFQHALETYRGLHVAIVREMYGPDCMALRLMVHGVHARDFLGFRATYRRISLPVICIAEFAGGKVCRLEICYDQQTLLSELGMGQTPPVR